MKKIYILVLIAAIAFSGCKKDSSTPTPTYTAQVTINNVKTNFTDVEYDITISSGVSSYYIINWGTENLTKDISISLLSPVVGTVDFSYYNGVDLMIGTKYYTSEIGDGTITITKKDSNELSGSFSGNFYDENDVIIAITGNFTSKFSSSTTL